MKCGMLIAIPLAVLVGLAGGSSPSSAQIGAEVFGAFNTYNMKDWNDQIDFWNGTGSEFDEINGGFGGGLGLRLFASPNFLISGVWEPVFITREDDVTGDELKLDGNSIQGTVAYFFPTAGNARYGLGAGVGYYMLGGEFNEASTGATADLEGNNVGFHFMGMGEWTMSPGFAVTAGAGYRVSKLDETESNDPTFPSNFETDYSGLMLRLGLAFYMGDTSR